MHSELLLKVKRMQRRRKRTRLKVRGTAERPRLSVFRSNRHIYAQLIDDVAGCTLAAASTLSKDLRGLDKKGKEAAEMVGLLLARKAKEKGIETCVFDRGPYKYHGRVKALAEGARKGGLRF